MTNDEMEKVVEKFKAADICKKWLYDMYAGLANLRWQHISVQNANFGKGTSAPQQVIIGDYNGWEFRINDDAVLSLEMGHDIDEDQDIEIHLTVCINEAYATASGELQFQVEYSVSNHNGGNALAPDASGVLVSGDVNIPATAYDFFHVHNLHIPAADYSHGSVIGVTLTRIAIDGGVNPTAHPVLTSLHLEYRSRLTDWEEEL